MSTIINFDEYVELPVKDGGLAIYAKNDNTGSPGSSNWFGLKLNFTKVEFISANIESLFTAYDVHVSYWELASATSVPVPTAE